MGLQNCPPESRAVKIDRIIFNSVTMSSGAELWKSISGQIQDGVGCPNIQSSTRYNSVADGSISLKCDTEFDHLTADILQCSRS